MAWVWFDLYNKGTGRSAILEWIEARSFGKKDIARFKVKMRTRIDMFEIENARHDPDYFKLLSGEGDGLFEMRFLFNKVQYRPLCYYGPDQGEVTVVAMATEHNNRWVPPGILTTAQANRALTSDRSYLVPHDY